MKSNRSNNLKYLYESKNYEDLYRESINMSEKISVLISLQTHFFRLLAKLLGIELEDTPKSLLSVPSTTQIVDKLKIFLDDYVSIKNKELSRSDNIFSSIRIEEFNLQGSHEITQLKLKILEKEKEIQRLKEVICGN